jgi:hypothetical protein
MTRLALILCTALALASCSTDPATGTTEQAIDSIYTVQLWDPSTNSGQGAFWRNGATTMQWLMQRGDAGGTLTRGNPTVYVWLIADGTTVHRIWRVATDQLAQFRSTMRGHFDNVEGDTKNPQYSASAYDGGAGTPDGGDPGHLPHIGPHGDGTTFFSQALVDQAISSAAGVRDAYANFRAQSALE